MPVFFLTDPCDNFPCKRGKTCKLGSDSKPACVCQVPSECPSSVNEFDHVSTGDLVFKHRLAFNRCINVFVVFVGLWDGQQNI